MDITLIQLGIKQEHARFLAEAANSFNASQSCYRLHTAKILPSPANPPLKWPECARDFVAQNRKTIVITDVQFDDNWFSHGDGSTSIVSTAEWFNVLEVPLALQCYLLTEFALACAMFSVEHDERTVPPHESAVGCLFDLCAIKADILLKLRAGYLCPDHVNRLSALGASADHIAAIERVLNLARAYALSRDDDKRRLGAIRNRRVFVVHGRDEVALGQLENLLHEVNVEPVVLKREPRHGVSTIIELIERYAEVGYAFILFTPDDVGAVAGELSMQRRSRQNVILECGLFLGLLGRRRVSCIVKNANLEMPSDLGGVLQHRFTHSVYEVKDEIKLELQRAGYPVP
jgi:predicted nucleotide-binding protein